MITHQEKRVAKTKDWTWAKVLQQSMTAESRQKILDIEERILATLKLAEPVKQTKLFN